MLDSYHWNFQGTGHEVNAETRVKPNPGYHYYEHSETRAGLLESLFGIHSNPHRRLKADKMLLDRAHELFPGGWGGGEFTYPEEEL